MKNKKDIQIFALMWSSIFFIIGFYPMLKGVDAKEWAIALATILLGVCILRPSLLIWLYKLWMKFGELMGSVVSKLILCILFFLIFTPIAFIFKLLKKDLLSKKIDREQKSYWLLRKEQPQSMKNQF